MMPRGPGPERPLGAGSAGPERPLGAGSLFPTAVVAGLILVGSGAGPVGAQTELGCPPDEGIDAAIGQSPTVFTGTVRALGNKGRTATIEVIRVWKGAPLPERVEVQGTIATQSKVVTALDRLYARDRTYLFLPTSGASPRFRENRCSATRQLTAELAAKAPGDGGAAPQGQGVPLPGADLGRFAPLMVGAPALAVLAGLLVAARRKSKRSGQPAATG
ncbi:MAG: hypothetical protein AVDCRST_MAG76-3442 [uncultured Acidimicrobiales bacterium]|uniref:Uncharacterized protein n=1 Tax=uncultured Acidimicrobiales bacterium TaxID=310071 RepID=A0A6J4JAP3_9ACTN|nr:MAG: hypothetical protein AVDCRST_MAG76-3442 [uncultured Acidimicrobiales bacterium]